MEENKLYTTAEIADKFQVTRQTLDKWKLKGLPFIRIDNIIRYNIDDVMEWVEQYNTKE